MDQTVITQRIIDKNKLEVAIKDIQSMSHEDYALSRKNYFGASDSSILCGVNLYKTLDDLIKEKNCKFITDEEKEVGEKAIVRKGFDLEPVILDKAFAELEKEGFMGILAKPEDMFKFKDVDGLSVNYDGVFISDTLMVPVEAKLVSKYGEKYYNKNNTMLQMKSVIVDGDSSNLEQHIKRVALRLGIPAYYYTQCQQEIAGLDAPYGFLAAMFDDTWTFKLFYVPRDEYVINSIYKLCESNINKIERDTK